MLTVALFSHSRYLCGAERMLLNLALLLERSRDDSARAAGARRRRVDLRGPPPRAGLPDRSRRRRGTCFRPAT